MKWRNNETFGTYDALRLLLEIEMRIAIIGRTEILYETAKLLARREHEIALIITSRAAPEYTRSEHGFKDLAKQFSISFFCTPRIIEI